MFHACSVTQERQKSLDQDTNLSKTRSLHNSTQLGPCYISPVQRQRNLTTTMRRDKSNQVGAWEVWVRRNVPTSCRHPGLWTYTTVDHEDGMFVLFVLHSYEYGMCVPLPHFLALFLDHCLVVYHHMPCGTTRGCDFSPCNCVPNSVKCLQQTGIIWVSDKETHLQLVQHGCSSILERFKTPTLHSKPNHHGPLRFVLL